MLQGDYSRFGFDRAKHYHHVLRQMGRVDLDADWNEDQAIRAYLHERSLADLIGPSGADGDGFRPYLAGSTDGDDGNGDDGDGGNEDAGRTPALAIAAGRMYVDGRLVENDGPVRYQGPAGAGLSVQPLGVPADEEIQVPDAGLPALPALDAAAPGGAERIRTDLIYLQAWDRHVTALEDPALREVALGGPDTTTRLQGVWRVRILPGVDVDSCAAEVAGFPPAPTGRGTLSTFDSPPSVEPDLCAVAPDRGGYRGTENRLYRVQIVAGGSMSGATFTWSDENAAVVQPVAAIDSSGTGASTLWRLRLPAPASDAVLAFHAGDVLQVQSGADRDQDRPGLFCTITAPPDGLDCTVDADLSGYRDETTNAPVAGTTVRRFSSLPLPVNADHALGDSGIGVSFAAGNNGSGNDGGTGDDGGPGTTGADDFRTGDFWLIPTRVRTAGYGPLLAAAPQGIHRHHARLGLLHWWRTTTQDGASVTATIQDCRPVIAPATSMTDLHYVGGDGQQAMPGKALPAPLCVRASRGGTPLAGAAVVFEAPGGGLRMPPGQDPNGAVAVVRTDDAGYARIGWTPAFGEPPSAAMATARPRFSTTPRVVFTAAPSIAAGVEYTPAAGCTLDADTVQQALDQLCARGKDDDPGLHVTDVFWGLQADRIARPVRPAAPARPRDAGEGGGAGTDTGQDTDGYTGDVAGQLLETVQGEGRIGGLRYAGADADDALLEAIRAAAAGQDMPYAAEATLHDGVVRFADTRRGAERVAREVAALIGVLEAQVGAQAVNGDTVPVSVLVSGLTVVCDDEVFAEVSRATCQLSVEVPFTGLGYQVAVLRAAPKMPDVAGNQIRWAPADGVDKALITALATAGRQFDEQQLLLRLLLKGNFIHDKGGRRYLDGEDYGSPDTPPHNLRPLGDPERPVYSGDGKRGGDFEMFFWLVADEGEVREDIGFVIRHDLARAEFNEILTLALDRKRYAEAGLLPERYEPADEPFDPDKAKEAMQGLQLERLPLQDALSRVPPVIRVPESLNTLYTQAVAADWEPFVPGRLRDATVADAEFVQSVGETPGVMLFCARSMLEQVAVQRGARYAAEDFVVL